ncbi:hypothetical protein BS50DRAFT_623863 [Corynespora cassiicola Philippines]|uniref:Uncharacterized protein n=1 Tax=Corynespora cassiicola Philippines TaxID=1448308 RepID=A0A2T2NC46_CORCC|nr:hypothetical protein BS50DRAFT_623863 [Corynespora cassiicola Philippines]
MYTCRAAAEETKGLALKANLITFRTSPTAQGENINDKYGRMTRSERFRRLLDHIALLKAETLCFAAGCVNQAVIDQVKKSFPEAGRDFELAMHEAASGTQNPDFYLSRTEYWSIDILDNDHSSIRKALQLAFDLVSSHSNFESLASEILKIDTDRGPLQDLTDWPSFYEVLKWKPDSWAIPDDLELSRIELMAIWDIQFKYCPPIRHIENPLRLKYRFSAGSLAINFLTRYHAHRNHMRLIQIYEDENSISDPWDHIYGLFPFYLENPQIQIEWHVNLLNGIFPYSVDSLTDLAEMDSMSIAENCMRKSNRFERLLERLIQWIDVAIDLPVPSTSFSLIFGNGPKQYDSWPIWAAVKHILMLYEAMFTCARMKNLDEYLLHHRFWPRYSPSRDIPAHIAEEIRFTGSVNFHRWHGTNAHPPSWLLDNFILVVRHMVLRTSKRIRFSDTAPLDPVCDVASLMEKISLMSIKEMREEWTNAISVELHFPKEWVTDMCKTYLFSNHYLRRMISAQPSDVLMQRVQPPRRSGRRRKKVKAVVSG